MQKDVYIREKNIMLIHITNFKKIKKFDFILMMDVLEHIEDDVDFLIKMKSYQKIIQ
ncbi:hypothetical protein C823_007161 [Eubacterium plexicaudatum ASF492]|nr:hypothetical protein C823_007161 [Eubacterium plexicaudatum ASF492]